MDKFAQKYKNPERERLSQIKENLFKEKKEWNRSVGAFQKELSLFQKELKRVKNLINGRADGKEKIKLHQPLPEETIAFLDSLKEKSSPALSSKLELGKEIVKNQYLYSQEYNNFYSGLEQKRLEKQNKQASLDYMLDDYLLQAQSYNTGTRESK